MTTPHNGSPDGRDVPFADIEATLVKLADDGRRRRRPGRALTATVIVVGTPDRIPAAAEALEALGHVGGVRAILISEGETVAPQAHVGATAVTINGLAPRYLNNAVAALRLSSLPAVVWWRGGFLEALDELADLADRLILDTDPPDEAWSHAPAIVEHTALSDLRWTSLTRWRSALAHLFDVPQVRSSAVRVTRLSIEAADTACARLFAGWLKSSLGWTSDVGIEIEKTGSHPLEQVELTGQGIKICLHIRQSRACLEASVDGVAASARVVPLGDSSLGALFAEELAVRTRDLAFERALAAAREISA